MSEETSKIVDAFLSECRALADAPPDRCIRCDSDDVSFNGTNTRSLSKLVLGVVVYIGGVMQRRLRCRPCQQRWLRRPAEVLPRAHYQACVISSAVAELAAGAATTAVASTHECDRRTVRRFVDRVASAGDPADVARELTAAVDAPVLPAVPVVERRAPLGLNTVRQLARAMSLLVLLDALGSVRGQEPPALGAFLRERAAVVPGDAQRKPRARDPPSIS
jgi:hypothetical protein